MDYKSVVLLLKDSVKEGDIVCIPIDKARNLLKPDQRIQSTFLIPVQERKREEGERMRSTGGQQRLMRG